MIRDGSPPLETVQPRPDLLIVLGKNIGVGSTTDDIREHRLHLSTDSRVSSIAAGQLYRPGMTILFSTGVTAEGAPAESRAMRDYMLGRFRHIPKEATVLEDTSIDTATNAKEVAKMLAAASGSEPLGLWTPAEEGTIGLLSVGYHIRRARKFFDNHGVPIDMTFASEDVIRHRSPHHDAYASAWSYRTPRVWVERVKELALYTLASTVDPQGEHLHKITARSRK